MSVATGSAGTLLFHEHRRRGAIHVLLTGVRFHAASAQQVLRGFFSEPWFSPRPITTGNEADRQTIHFNGGDGSYLEVRNLRPAILPSGLPGLQTGVTARLTWSGGALVGNLEGALWKGHWKGELTEDLEQGSVDFVETFFSQAGRLFCLLPGPLRYKVARGFAGLHVKFAPYHLTLPPRIAEARSRADDYTDHRELDCSS